MVKMQKYYKLNNNLGSWTQYATISKYFKKDRGYALIENNIFGLGCSNLYVNQPAFLVLKVNTRKLGKIEFTQ